MPNNKNEIYYHKGSIGSVSARILSVLKDSKGNIWIGTDGNGLIKTNPVTGKESQHLTFKNSVEGFYVQSLIEDDNGNIWIGTFKNGLWIYDWKSDQFSKINVSIPNGIQATNISTLFKDSKGRIWIGSDISVALYDKNKYELFSFSYYDKGLYGEISRSIIEDSNKNIWVGMDRGGLFKFNETSELEKSNFQRHAFTKEGNGVNEYYAVPSMVADSNNGIWLLNFKGELSYFNTVDFSFIDYNEFDPLNDANFRALLLQDDNNLWLSSTQGIWNFNVKDSIIRKYYKTDGFQDDFYLHKSAFKDTSGILYFGGLNGINGFDPNSISTEPVNTQLHITTIEILNKSASELIPDQIKNGIENVKQITLGNSQSSFSFRFSVIGNILNSNYFYTYRLKGFNDDWKTTKNERIASYTNIPPGNYTFEVKAGTKKGLWDIPIKTIEIKVTPPFWNHPIAYLLYFILFCTIIYMIYRWYKLRRNLFFQKLKNSQEKQIYREKVNFFSKMSHEIQTPLTLILGPIENMLKNAETDGNLLLNQRLNIVANNAKILSKIAFDLTTIRNKEIGQLKLKVYKRDVIKKINETSESFLEQARLKNIDFERKNFVESFELWFDGELIEHIIYNLLSNAFKFTPRDGKITIQTKISDQKNMFIIKVKDSGYGISEKEQANIFKLFYRANEMKDSEGTGIGLALVKEFIDLHKGQVYVDSKMGVGTEFTVYLPLNKDVYTNEEIVDDFAKEQISENKIKIQLPQELINIEKSKKKKHSLLIVEDNFDMQYFLKDLFSKYYNVILADNGSEGLAIAEKQQPNIIISDVSMPIMNGIEMCKKLQENHRTYHIPIILLTAKNSTKTKFEGLGHGAVEFINKPFDIKELLLKTHNILTNYEKSISNFTAQYLSVPQQTKSKPKDVVFLEDLIRKLNSELNNPEFKLDSLADTFNMSYSVIYRKCQKLTGKTIIDLFRLMRLKKAAILISKNGYSISEACFAVGFNDTKYFSRSFKEEFNITPSGFKKEALASDFDSFLEKYKLH
nr:ATP-binding protein [Gelidibacter japonicus]